MCDTIAALAEACAGPYSIVAKNSDRPPNEAQPLVCVPATDFPRGSKLRCTYITIDQVLHTNRVIGSKPHWMWGFEHGVNDHGVAIGNEAVFSREPLEKRNGLLGMDLLRLALERGDTAVHALHTIVDLLERYGQGGESVQKGALRYHNSFIIADSEEGWVLETSNRRWVARRIRGADSISNIYSTECEWDEISRDAIDYAVRQGWARRNEDFSFARAYTDTTMDGTSGFQARYARSKHLLASAIGQIKPETIFGILRDHHQDSMYAPRWSNDDGLIPGVCCHAASLRGYKTAASMVAILRRERSDEMNFTLWTSMSTPCTSVFEPFYNLGSLPEVLSKGGEKYRSDSPWWKTERVTRLVELNYSELFPAVHRKSAALESCFLKESVCVEDKARSQEALQERSQTLSSFSERCLKARLNLANELIQELTRSAKSLATVSTHRLVYLREAAMQAGMKLPGI